MTQETTGALRVAQGACGVILAGFAVAAVRVDVINNYEYGATISREMSIILVISALSVAVLPATASLTGWNKHLKATTLICTTLTCWAALNAYATRQGQGQLDAKVATTAYAEARADAARAREVLSRIKETGPIGELTKLEAFAATKLAGETNAADGNGITCSQSKSCRAADDAYKSIVNRLSDAKARDVAVKALDAAKDEARVGPKEASAVAVWIAGYVGCQSEGVAQTIAMILSLMCIAVTQALALMGHYSVNLISGAFTESKRDAAQSDRALASASLTTDNPHKIIALLEKPTISRTKPLLVSSTQTLDRVWSEHSEITPQEIKTHRKALKLTQVEMARACKVSVSAYRKWEQGINRIPSDILVSSAA
jgi:hypothetical protein